LSKSEWVRNYIGVIDVLRGACEKAIQWAESNSSLMALITVVTRDIGPSSLPRLHSIVRRGRLVFHPGAFNLRVATQQVNFGSGRNHRTGSMVGATKVFSIQCCQRVRAMLPRAQLYLTELRKKTPEIVNTCRRIRIAVCVPFVPSEECRPASTDAHDWIRRCISTEEAARKELFHRNRALRGVDVVVPWRWCGA
jgi:hypothetical protein